LIWYTNSFLASLLSIIGCLAAIGGFYDMTNVDGVLTREGAFGAIAGGIALVIIGKVISVRKAGKSAGQAQQSAENTYQTSPVKSKRVGVSAIFAGILFLLTAAFLFIQWEAMDVLDALSPEGCALIGIEIAAYVALIAACFHTRAAQKASGLHAIGYVLLTGLYSWNSYDMYQVFGFDTHYYADGSAIYGLTLVHVLLTVAFLLMLLVSICARGGAKGVSAVIVKILWLAPAIVMAAVTVKDIVDYRIVEAFEHWIDTGRFSGIEYYAGLAATVCANLAVMFSGWSLMRLCSRYRAKRVRVSPEN